MEGREKAPARGLTPAGSQLPSDRPFPGYHPDFSTDLDALTQRKSLQLQLRFEQLLFAFFVDYLDEAPVVACKQLHSTFGVIGKPQC